MNNFSIFIKKKSNFGATSDRWISDHDSKFRVKIFPEIRFFWPPRDKIHIKIRFFRSKNSENAPRIRKNEF